MPEGRRATDPRVREVRTGNRRRPAAVERVESVPCSWPSKSTIASCWLRPRGVGTVGRPVGGESPRSGRRLLRRRGFLIAKRPGHHGPVDPVADSRGARSEVFLLSAPSEPGEAFAEERTPRSATGSGSSQTTAPPCASGAPRRPAPRPSRASRSSCGASCPGAARSTWPFCSFLTSCVRAGSWPAPPPRSRRFARPSPGPSSASRRSRVGRDRAWWRPATAACWWPVAPTPSSIGESRGWRPAPAAASSATAGTGGQGPTARSRAWW